MSVGRGATPLELPPGVAERGFLARLSPELVGELIQSGHSVAYPTGSIIETPARAGLALIVAGALRYYLSAADGRQLTVGYLGPGNVIGTVESESTALVRIQVIAPTTLLHMQPERVRALIHRSPDLTQALLDEATHGLRHSFRVLAASAFMTVRARVARDIIERASLAGPLRAGLRLAVTHQSLADATGSVREVVARTLRKLSREGVISTGGGGITVLDPDALMHLAGYVT
ncbi:MAG TPA: Crp/Fnr family transcriptional regulator [Candidatus Limnocylindrales bacterium]|nr:Crp/Fnr family transcriptional regulator [Candidatus Limnocylindrales bacterium]